MVRKHAAFPLEYADEAEHKALEDYLHKIAAKKTAAEVSPSAEEEDPAGDSDIDAGWPEFNEDAAGEWLRGIQARAEESTAKDTPTHKMVGYAVSLLHDCRPAVPAESQELLRKEFMTLVDGKASSDDEEQPGSCPGIPTIRTPQRTAGEHAKRQRGGPGAAPLHRP